MYTPCLYPRLPLNILLKKSSIPPLFHPLHLSQPPIKDWLSGFFALSDLSFNHPYIVLSPQSCSPWLQRLRELAQHLSPSCCRGVQFLWLPAWASLCCVLYEQAAAAIPPGHLHSVAITETVRPLKSSGAHRSSH